mgnify:CR=1 FL=1
MKYTGAGFTTYYFALLMANPTVTIILSILQLQVEIMCYPYHTKSSTKLNNMVYPYYNGSDKLTVVTEPLVLPLRLRLAAGERAPLPAMGLVVFVFP